DEFQRGLPPLLDAHAAVDDEQPLGAAVRMPVRAAALLELDAIDVRRHADIVCREALGPRRTRERTGVGRGERDGLAAKYIHRSYFFLNGMSGRGSAVNPFRFGIFTWASVVWSMTSCSWTMPFMNRT